MYLIRKWAFNDMLNIKERQKTFPKNKMEKESVVFFFFYKLCVCCSELYFLPGERCENE